MDSDLIAGEPPIGLRLFENNTYILDGETLALSGNSADIAALNIARIDLINGAHLTVSPAGLGVNALDSVTYGIGDSCTLKLAAAPVSLNLANSTTVDFAQSAGTGKFQYAPGSLNLKLASPIKIINLHEGDTIRVVGAPYAEMKGNTLSFSTSQPKPEPGPSRGTLGQVVKTVGNVVNGVTNQLGQVLGVKAVFEVHPDAKFIYAPTGRNDGVIIKTPCFLSGTFISTPLGEIPVEKLRKGDLVYIMNGNAVPVTWVGRRTIDPKAVDRLRDHAPIRIRPGALDHGTPNRNLYVSPDHCLFLSGSLIPAKFLINGTSITQNATLEPFTYHHIELEQHSVLIADGAYAESYLDLDNRAKFLELGTLMFLSPANTRKAVHCYPPVYSGSTLDAIRETLELRAGELGYSKDKEDLSQASTANVFPFYKQIQ